MVHDTPSKTLEMGYLPVSEHPTCSETRNENLHGPQMAVTSSRLEPSHGSWSQCVDDRKLRNYDVVNEKGSKANIETENEMTIASSRWQTQVGYQYPPVPPSKAPDKGGR
jgi:hypothetical protein